MRTFCKKFRTGGKKKWNKVFKNEPSKICGRQPIKTLLGPFLLPLSKINQVNADLATIIPKRAMQTGCTA